MASWETPVSPNLFAKSKKVTTMSTYLFAMNESNIQDDSGVLLFLKEMHTYVSVKTISHVNADSNYCCLLCGSLWLGRIHADSQQTLHKNASNSSC